MSSIYGEFGDLSWRKAKRSMNGGNCVEVASATGAVVVRDSKNPQGSILRYTSGSWLEFIGEARLGKFDTIR